MKPTQPADIPEDLVVPKRGDPPATFTPQTQTFLDRQYGEVVPAMNAQAAYVNESNDYIDGQLAEAENQVALAAAQVALAADQVALAENQVTLAENQVTLATEQALNAESQKLQTVALTASYADGHQGSHDTFITTRNDGSPLQDGDMFYYSVDKKTYIWRS